MNEYDKHAQAFLDKTGATIGVKYLETAKLWDTDKESRDIYTITITRGNQKYVYKFGQSLNNTTGHGGKPPSAYDVLACVQTSAPGTFEDFCQEYGYDEDSRRVEKTYKALLEEYTRLCALFSDEEMEVMQEIN